MLQMVCIATFVCGVVHHILVQSRSSLVKKGKKKKENAFTSVNVPSVSDPIVADLY